MARYPDPETRRRWRRVLEQFDSEVETVAEFCRRHGISTASFYAWRRKLRTEPADPVSPQAASAFLPLQVRRETQIASSTVRFRLGEEAAVDVPAECEQLILQLAAFVLDRCGETS